MHRSLPRPSSQLLSIFATVRAKSLDVSTSSAATIHVFGLLKSPEPGKIITSFPFAALNRFFSFFKAIFERKPLNPKEKIKPFKIIKQPKWVMTMEDNLKHYGEPLWRYLKNVVYKNEKGKIFIASVRGDQNVNEIKFKRALGKELE